MFVPSLPTGQLTLRESSPCGTGTLRLVWEVTTPPTAGWSYRPGQFINLGFAGELWRSYSLTSLAAELPLLELLVRVGEDGFGPGTRHLLRMRVGETLPYRGAYGRFQLMGETDTRQICIATGTGIAPFRSLLRGVGGQRVMLLYGEKTLQHVSYSEEIAQWQAETVLCLSRDEKNHPILSTHHGRVTDYLEAHPELLRPSYHYYLCGSSVMLESAGALLRQAGVERRQIHTEQFY
ncbi:FAD-dependent oxidoreductase [Candidatus Peribacteria bacterium]|nr:FAD-dependent oxidoreductase [Candidatus Peribacteria bacterium]